MVEVHHHRQLPSCTAVYSHVWILYGPWDRGSVYQPSILERIPVHGTGAFKLTVFIIQIFINWCQVRKIIWKVIGWRHKRKQDANIMVIQWKVITHLLMSLTSSEFVLLSWFSYNVYLIFSLVKALDLLGTHKRLLTIQRLRDVRSLQSLL